MNADEQGGPDIPFRTNAHVDDYGQKVSAVSVLGTQIGREHIATEATAALHFEVVAGRLEGRSFHLFAAYSPASRTIPSLDAIRLGRLPRDCQIPGKWRLFSTAGLDLAIDDALMSRVHCQLAPGPAGDWYIRDLRSRNGTKITVCSETDPGAGMGPLFSSFPGYTGGSSEGNMHRERSTARFDVGDRLFRVSQGDLISVGDTALLTKEVIPRITDAIDSDPVESGIGVNAPMSDCWMCRFDVAAGALRCSECGTPLVPRDRARRSAKRFYRHLRSSCESLMRCRAEMPEGRLFQNNEFCANVWLFLGCDWVAVTYDLDVPLEGGNEALAQRIQAWHNHIMAWSELPPTEKVDPSELPACPHLMYLASLPKDNHDVSVRYRNSGDWEGLFVRALLVAESAHPD